MITTRVSLVSEPPDASYFPQNWQRFIKQYWNRQATVIHKPLEPASCFVGRNFHCAAIGSAAV